MRFATAKVTVLVSPLSSITFISINLHCPTAFYPLRNGKPATEICAQELTYSGIDCGPRALAHAGLSRCCSARRLAGRDGRSRLARRLHRGVASGVVICHLNVVNVEAEIRLEGRAAHRALVEREVVEAVVADTQVAAW